VTSIKVKESINLTTLAEWQRTRPKTTAAERLLGFPEREMSTKRTWIGGPSMSALPPFSDVDLLGHGKRIVHLDP
jgi:hypothetical protein